MAAAPTVLPGSNSGTHFRNDLAFLGRSKIRENNNILVDISAAAPELFLDSAQQLFASRRFR
jgi:hypothetical protein